MIYPHIPSHLAHLPRVSGMTLHTFPHATLTLEDGTTRDMDSSTRASIMPPTERSEGWCVLVMAWDNPEGEVFAVPPEVVPEVLPAFPERGVVAHVELEDNAILITTCTGTVYTYARPIGYSVGQDLDGNHPDTLKLTDEAGWIVGIFEISKDTPGAEVFYSAAYRRKVLASPNAEAAD